MSDCNCEDIESHIKIITEILLVRKNIDKEQMSPRVSMLMRVIANDLKSTGKHAQVRKELVQAAAACIMHLEKLT